MYLLSIINRYVRKVGGILAKGIPLPSFFDVCVLGFIVLLPTQKGDNRGIFLVHGSLFILLVGLVTKRIREYRSWPLFILVVWAGINMFWRSFSGLQAEDGKVTQFFTSHVNWALLHEGFIYIFCGIVLICSIIEHAKLWKLYFIPLLYWVVFWIGYKGFNMMGLEKVMKDATHNFSVSVGWSMTLLLSLVLAGFITLLLKKKWKLSIPIGLLGLGVIIYKWSYLWKSKWISRPDVWIATIKRIVHSKGLGYGFYHTVNTATGLISPELQEFSEPVGRWGRYWRHNDFLEITEYLGVIAFICIVWFVVETLWKTKLGLAFYLGLSALLMCCFQRTMFFPVQAGIIEVIIALIIIDKYELAKTTTF